MFQRLIACLFVFVMLTGPVNGFKSSVSNLSGVATAYFDGKVFFIGGTSESGGKTVLTSSVYSLNTTMSFGLNDVPVIEIAQLPYPMSNVQVFVSERRIYIAGGLIEAGGTVFESPFLHWFDPTANNITFTRMKSNLNMGIHMSASSMAIDIFNNAAGFTVSFGSIKNENKTDTEISTFRTEVSKWNSKSQESISSLRDTPSPRAFATITHNTPNDKSFYVAGGMLENSNGSISSGSDYAAGTATTEYRIYNGTAGKWIPESVTRKVRMMVPREGHCSCIFRNYLIHLGGTASSADLPAEYMNLMTNVVAGANFIVDPTRNGGAAASVVPPDSLKGCALVAVPNSRFILVIGGTWSNSTSKGISILRVTDGRSKDTLDFEWVSSFEAAGGITNIKQASTASTDSSGMSAVLIIFLVLLGVTIAICITFGVINKIRKSREISLFQINPASSAAAV